MIDTVAVRSNNVNLAMGDLFGSTMANMVILAGADLAAIRHRLLTRVAINQLLVGATAISLTAIIVAGTVSGDSATVPGVSWAPLAAFGSYVAAMRILHGNRGVSIPDDAPCLADADQRRRLLWRSIFGFAVGTVVILFTAQFLADS